MCTQPNSHSFKILQNSDDANMYLLLAPQVYRLTAFLIRFALITDPFHNPLASFETLNPSRGYTSYPHFFPFFTHNTPSHRTYIISRPFPFWEPLDHPLLLPPFHVLFFWFALLFKILGIVPVFSALANLSSQKSYLFIYIVKVCCCCCCLLVSFFFLFFFLFHFSTFSSC